jgi:hypothetical protein
MDKNLTFRSTAYGAMVKFPEIGTLALIGTVYNRTLIGIVIGIGDNIDLHPVLRGAIIGVIVSLAMAIFDGAWILLGFGIVYGILTDVITSGLEGRI